MTRKTNSLDRVVAAAQSLGLEIQVQEMDVSTRSAEDAARAVGCDVAQIVKSLIFERQDNGDLVLALVSGAHHADIEILAQHFGSALTRADPRKIRDVTGFAIGGVAPIGHLQPIATVMDAALLAHDHVWAAAGKPMAVFKVQASAMRDVLDCVVIDVK